MRAYAEIYLDDAMNNLGGMFDYAVNDCGYDGEEFLTYFIICGVAAAFERGNPKYVAGLSGPELAAEIIFRTYKTRLDIQPAQIIDRSAEYWVGWNMAYYQWFTARRFADMQKYGLTMERMLALYPTLHEADITKFVAVADQIIAKNSAGSVSNLQRLRKANSMTQSRLAQESGAALRMIQLYEQRQQDINKAQAATLNRIAHVLGCRIEDLLEIE